LPAREIVKKLSKNFLKEASKFYLMPYSDDEEHSPSEFYYPDEISDETNDPNGRLEGENGFSSEKVFCFFLLSQNKLRFNKAI
jgi:5-methylcytosine-specific restriction endonuclease McrBC GTP-binding regulatory subunit McrB